MSPKILLLEDDELFCESLKDFLEESNFVVETAKDAKEALEKSYAKRFNLYIFDIKVPYMSGFDLLEALRRNGDATPTIFLTSLKDKESLSEGFRAGCDDYIKKPVDMDELLMRIHAMLRRGYWSEQIEFGEFTFDCVRNRLFKNNEEVFLTPKELDLLSLLIKERGKVVTHEMIVDKLWSSSEQISSGAIRVYINDIKKAIGKERITNIRGVGYRFEQE